MTSLRPVGRAALGALLAAIAVVAVACGSTMNDRSPSFACSENRTAITKALQRAPGAVTLTDGTALSACVRNAVSDAALQDVGIVFSQAAEDLEARATEGDRRAALQLGYLVGATRRGAATTNGVSAELVRRIERSAVLDGTGPAVQAAVQQGLRAGEARG